MKPKRVILCPNPYRDSELKVCKQSRDMLESLGMQTSVLSLIHISEPTRPY